MEDHKTVTIIVEGTPHHWPEEYISHTQVVALEFPDHAQQPKITYTVMYNRGPRNRPEGTLSKGNSVKVVEGMVFNVTQTGKS